MKQTDLLIPFGLPPAELAVDLTRAMQAPALATLLARAEAAPIQQFDDFSRALPHEDWLARRFGLAPHGSTSAAGQTDQHSPAFAAAARTLLAPAVPDEGYWFMLQPVHCHIARDHLVLTDHRALQLTETESRALYAEALPLFSDSGMQLVYGAPNLWFLRADAWSALQTATPDAACGHNIDIWLPKGEAARPWRKLQNEVQMTWHDGVVNRLREERGVKPVNALWLWGGAAQAQAIASPYSHYFGMQGWMAALARRLPALADLPDAGHCHVLAGDDSLSPAALGADWGEWLARLHVLETDCFAPLLAALQAGRIERLRLVLGNNVALREFTVTRNSLRKFWRRPNLGGLLP
jgi:hypothetical protein